MLKSLEDLSLGSGALVVAALSFLLALLSAWIRPLVLRWSALLGVPLVLTWSLYWLPVWRGANPSEYSAWVTVCVVPWFLSGALASAVAALGLRALRRHLVSSTRQ